MADLLNVALSTVSLPIALIKRFYWSPKLILEYEPQPPFRKWPIYDPTAPMDRNPQIWERVRVRNTGKRAVENVRIRLIEIRKQDEAGKMKIQNYHDPTNLWWSGVVRAPTGELRRDFKSRPLPPTDSEYADLLWHEMNNNVLHLCIYREVPSGRISDLEAGTYLFKLRAYSDTSNSKECILRVEYDPSKTKPDEILKVRKLNWLLKPKK